MGILKKKFINRGLIQIIMKTKLSLLLSALLLVLFMVNCQQKEQENTVYVRTLGSDTLSAETLVRESHGFHGQYLSRMPATQVGDYNAQLASDGSVSNLSVTWSTPEKNPDGPASKSLDVTINDTVATVQMSGKWQRGQDIDTTYTLNVPSGAIPGIGTFPPSIGTLTQAVSQATDINGDSGYTVNIISPGSQRIISAPLTQMGGDTLAIKIFGVSYPFKVNDQGKITWFSAKNSTVKTVTKLKTGDLQPMAAKFATMDAKGNGLPVASPKDTVDATISGTHLQVIYSRPSKRGRKIWGSLVPWNKVWRTGANAATQFSTDQDLEINGTTVPAGTYTLYSIYTPDSATLIINKQTGQWGTEYHKDQDLSRIDMEKTDAGQPYEMFTISFDTTASSPMMQLTWDTTRYQLPVAVK